MAKRKPTTAKKKSTGARSRKASREVLAVASKVKGAIRTKGCNTSGDAVDGLNEIIHWYIDQATTRAKANGRKTVRAHDFIAM